MNCQCQACRASAEAIPPRIQVAQWMLSWSLQATAPELRGKSGGIMGESYLMPRVLSEPMQATVDAAAKAIEKFVESGA